MSSEDLDSLANCNELSMMKEDSNCNNALESLEDDMAADICQICENKLKSPKVLACLHVFCEECLKKKLEDDKAEESASPTSPLAKEWITEMIQCPICEQKTRLGDKGIAGLLSDSVLEDMINSESKDKKQVILF